VVLVLPQWFSLLQERREHLLQHHGRERIPRHLRRRAELYRASVGYGAGAGGAGREVRHLRAENPARENVLANDEVLAEIRLPAAKAGVRGTYHKEMDREAWTHAIVSVAAVLEMDAGVCKSARVVLGGVAPIPWRVPKVEAMLAGKRITPELAAQAGAAAIEGARPLGKNQYKVPLTQAVVKQTLVRLAG
jgi:xanthine dehydrogenase YagS FAD-binding subunit